MKKQIREYDGMCDYCREMGDCIVTPDRKWGCPDCISDIILELRSKNNELRARLAEYERPKGEVEG